MRKRMMRTWRDSYQGEKMEKDEEIKGKR